MTATFAPNALLTKLSVASRQRLLSDATAVDLRLGAVLVESGARTRSVLFPLSGFLSLVTAGRGLPTLEVGLIGREGVLGAHLSLGVDTAPLRVLVQDAGTAMRVTAAHFRTALVGDPELGTLVARYLYVQLRQLATAAACAGKHPVVERLARWLLMSHDRAAADEFVLTQQFAGYMLGVRRVSVTVAAAELQRRGLLRYSRGRVTVIDRAGLRAAACGCYASDLAVYRRVMR